MARRRNTGLYEDLSPSLVVPDHFSTNQSSTIVIIYDEQVGMKEDQLTFVFPGEVSGGPLKRVVPQRIDSRTFVLETPTYSALRRGFVHVTPQLKLYTGELAEMADFKISLKHPVRSVMEMCLNLSTQQAVLPVLLTLIMHSKQDESDFFQDPHFDQIMATLVGSMEPKKHHIKDLILPDKKWKKVHLTEFARRFNMQEMEKQAYLLSQRSKEKRKGDKHCQNITGASDEERNIEASLFQSQFLSSSTPNINHATSVNLFPHASKSIGKADAFTPPVRKKKPPKVPKKINKSVEDIWSSSLRSSQKFETEIIASTYDEVQFDAGANEGGIRLTSPTEPILPRPKLPKLRAPIVPLAGQGKAKDEDTDSLDSYEEMNEVSWDNAGKINTPQDHLNMPLPLPPSSRMSVDDRPMMPIPPDTSPPPSGAAPVHYTLSTKNKSKANKKMDENRPLPPEPKYPPPPSKPPLPNPKPPDLKNRTPAKRFTRRRKDVYVSDSDSDTDNMQSNDEERPPVALPNRQNHPHTHEASAGAAVDPFEDDTHMYDSAEVVPAEKRAGKGRGASVSEDRRGAISPPARNSNGEATYENVELEPSYDQNPTLPPRQDRPPTLPPKTSPQKFRNSELIPSHKNTPAKMSQPPPPPPAKQKPPTPPPKLPSAGQRQSLPPNNFRTPTKTKKTSHQQQSPSKNNQMSELSSVLSNRNAMRGSGGDIHPLPGKGFGETFPQSPTVALKKNHWRQPRNY